MPQKRKKPRSIMVSFITIACGVYFGILLLMFIFQSRLVYFPSKEIICTPSDLRLEYEDVTISTADGTRINAWYVPASKPAGTLLFCHGNGGNMCYSMDVIRNFSAMGCNVMLFDYRGYGKSGGSPSEKGTYTDAQAAYDWLLKEKKIPEKDIIIMGRSLGGAIASNLAKDNNPGMLILESTFTSTADVGASAYPFLPVRLLCRFGYRTIDNVRKIRCPVLVVHSPDDEIVPFSNGKKIFEAAKDPKEFLQIRGTHNEGMDDSGEIYFEGLRKFVEGHR